VPAGFVVAKTPSKAKETLNTRVGSNPGEARNRVVSGTVKSRTPRN